ncbi:MAG: PEP-CTERM sorting domain-containing protein [Planctomycetota bacterium]
MRFTSRETVLSTTLSIVLLCLGSTASADLVIGFSDDGGISFSDDFEVATGDGLTIDVFLRQNGVDTVLTDEGIVAWGFDLTHSPTGLGTIADPTVNPVFDFENHNVITSDGFEWEYAETASLGIRGNDILLGSFQFNASSEGTTTFTVEDRLVGTGVGNANWITSSFASLDEEIFGVGAADTYQFSVNSIVGVPEPNSLLMFGLLGMSVLHRRRRSVASVRRDDVVN